MSQVLFVLLTACAPEGESLDTGWSLDASVKEDVVKVPKECPSYDHPVSGKGYASSYIDWELGGREAAAESAVARAHANALVAAGGAETCAEPCTEIFTEPDCTLLEEKDFVATVWEYQLVSVCYSCAKQWQWVPVLRSGVSATVECKSEMSCTEF